VAVIGENRKLLISRSRNCRKCLAARRPPAKIQGWRISDAKVFSLKEGLIWKDAAGRTVNVPVRELRDWIGNAPKPGACRQKDFRRTTGSDEAKPKNRCAR